MGGVGVSDCHRAPSITRAGRALVGNVETDTLM